MNYKITITDKNNTERTITSTRPNAGTFWELLNCLENGKIKSFNISK